MKSINLTAVIRHNPAFFSLYALLLLVGIYPFWAWDQVSISLWINGNYHPLLDQMFFYLTHLGSGITYLLMLVLFYRLKLSPRKLLIGGTSFVVMSLIVQFLKRIAFPDQLRPIALVPDPTQLHLVDQVTILREMSFPSGHAATIFTAVSFLALMMPPKKKLYQFYGVLLLILATSVAYSRVYLCQHFYRDIYIGMLIGGLVTPLVYAYLVGWQVPHWLAKRLPIKL